MVAFLMSEPKFNPFRPNNITHHGMFVGRLVEIRAIERCLFQTKNGSPQHFLVQGERGIGKSSLLHYVKLIADGELPTLSGIKLNYLTVHVDLGSSQTRYDVVRAIAKSLKLSISRSEFLKEHAKNVFEWITNWEALGFKYNKPEENSELESITEDFVSKIAAFCSSGDFDGVLFC